MFLNVSLDGRDWKVYWCEVKDPFLNMRTDPNEEVFTSFHLGFFNARPSEEHTEKPDTIEFYGERKPCLGYSFYIYSYETFNLVPFFEHCMSIHLIWNQKIITEPFINTVVIVKPKQLLSMKQKWKITDKQITAEKTDTKYPLDDIEVMFPKINPSVPLLFEYKSRQSQEILEEKCLSLDAFQSLFNACFTNIAKSSFV